MNHGNQIQARSANRRKEATTDELAEDPRTTGDAEPAKEDPAAETAAASDSKPPSDDGADSASDFGRGATTDPADSQPDDGSQETMPAPITNEGIVTGDGATGTQAGDNVTDIDDSDVNYGDGAIATGDVSNVSDIDGSGDRNAAQEGEAVGDYEEPPPSHDASGGSEGGPLILEPNVIDLTHYGEASRDGGSDSGADVDVAQEAPADTWEGIDD